MEFEFDEFVIGLSLVSPQQTTTHQLNSACDREELGSS